MTPEQLLPTLETVDAFRAAILAIYLRSDIDDPDEYVIDLCLASMHHSGLDNEAVNMMIEDVVQHLCPEQDPLDWDFLAG